MECPWHCPRVGIFGGFPFKTSAGCKNGLTKPGGVAEPNDVGGVNRITCDEIAKLGMFLCQAPCMYHKPTSLGSKYKGGSLGSPIVNTYLQTGEGTQPNTKWTKGGEARVAQGWWFANHGGGNIDQSIVLQYETVT